MLCLCLVYAFTIDLDAFVTGSPNLQHRSTFKDIYIFQTSFSPFSLLQE